MYYITLPELESVISISQDTRIAFSTEFGDKGMKVCKKDVLRWFMKVEGRIQHLRALMYTDYRKEEFSKKWGDLLVSSRSGRSRIYEEMASIFARLYLPCDKKSLVDKIVQQALR